MAKAALDMQQMSIAALAISRTVPNSTPYVVISWLACELQEVNTSRIWHFGGLQEVNTSRIWHFGGQDGPKTGLSRAKKESILKPKIGRTSWGLGFSAYDARS